LLNWPIIDLLFVAKWTTVLSSLYSDRLLQTKLQVYDNIVNFNMRLNAFCGPCLGTNPEP